MKETSVSPLLGSPEPDAYTETLKTRYSSYLGLCFFLLMGPLGCAMSLLTSIFSSVGQVSICPPFNFISFVTHICVKVIFIGSSFFGSSLIDVLGVKEVLTSTAFCFLGLCSSPLTHFLALVGMCIAALVFDMPWLVVIGGITLGIGSGPLWLAQGVLDSFCAVLTFLGLSCSIDGIKPDHGWQA